MTAETVSAETLDKLVLVLVSGVRDGPIQDALAKLEIPPARRAAALKKARQKITLAADYHRDEQLGRAIVRLEDIYRRSLAIQDSKTALGAQRELNRLLSLYPAAPTAAATATNGDEGPQAAEAAAARAHLIALNLAPEETGLAELCRLAAAEIIRLWSLTPNPNP